MRTITLVTGNNGKLAAWQRIFPADFKLEAIDLDLDEIQSLDAIKIVEDKARRAYEHLKKPVIVDDIAAGLDHLSGLPGPFVKYFEQKLGKEALYILAGKKEVSATIDCAAAYYDGKNLLVGVGSVKGTVVSARGENGFGFDFVFKPEGQTKTYGEMTFEEKDPISHRYLAIEDLVTQLKKL